MFKKSFFTAKTIALFAILAVLILLGAVSGPISDYYTIKDANPTMIKLAQAADMSRKGELIFLRANPQLVSASELAKVCPDSQTNDDGFAEQGCYKPSPADPTTGRIYLLQMTSDLYDVEVTTAAYEMLHPVYFSLTEGSATASNLNQCIESNYNSSLNDPNLNSQVSNFAKTEPGARDLELFSILGTEYSNISSSLTGYYAPYFKNIGTDVSLNNQINQLFQNDQTQLSQLNNTINTDESEANTAYADSVSWANIGNESENTYNYNIYLQDYNAATSAINQYNDLVEQYNTLVTEITGGEQINQDAPAQSQAAQ